MSSTTRISVIGGGIAGLIAANTILDASAEPGRRVHVTVIDRAEHGGGRARTTGHHGYRFNQGPHALYVDGELMAALRRFGIEPSGGAPAQWGSQALWRGELHRLPAGPASLVATDLLGVRGKVELGRLLARIPGYDPLGARGATVDEWIDHQTTDETVAAVLRAVVRLTTYSAAADIGCAEAAVIQLQRALGGGVLYLDGGWGQVIAALQARLGGAGGTIEHRTVTSVDVELARCDAVVVAVGGPGATGALTNATFDPAAIGPAVDAAVYGVGARTMPTRPLVLGIDEPLYGSVHAPPADLAPPGHIVVSTARYLAPGENHHADHTRADLAAHVARLGLDPVDLVTDRYLHRMTVAHGQPVANAAGGLGCRPSADVLGRPEVAIAGDWIGPTGLLADASAASGVAAATHVLAGSRVVAA
ncbi:MAG: NAD(P)-binding protein [Actinomycetota bacterium]